MLAVTVEGMDAGKAASRPNILGRLAYARNRPNANTVEAAEKGMTRATARPGDRRETPPSAYLPAPTACPRPSQWTSSPLPHSVSTTRPQ